MMFTEMCNSSDVYSQAHAVRFTTAAQRASGAPSLPSWRPLASETGVTQAVWASGGAWLLEKPRNGESQLLCCTDAYDLSSGGCAPLLRKGLPAAGLHVAVSAVDSSVFAAAIAWPSGVMLGNCSATSPCSCSWAHGTANLGHVADVAISGVGEPAYVAAATGLYSALQSKGVATVEAVGAVPAGVPYVAVASRAAGDAGTTRIAAVCNATTLEPGTSAASIWFLGAGGRWRHEWARGLIGLDSPLPTALAFAGDDTLWVGAPNALLSYSGAPAVLRRIRGREGLPSDRVQGLAVARVAGNWSSSSSPRGAPSPAAVWVATAAGAAWHRPGLDGESGTGGRSGCHTASDDASDTDGGYRPWYNGWQWFSGPRWLPSLNATPAVSYVSTDPRSASGGGRDAALLTTADGGVSVVWHDPCYSLAAKEAALRAALPRHEWNGLNAHAPLARFGDAATASPTANDNHGLWTSWRFAAEALRYNASAAGTAERAAAATALRRTLAAVARLFNVTGVRGLVARSMAAPGDARAATKWGWNPSPALPGWWFIGNTSSDELSGHLFAYPLALRFAAGALSAGEAATVRALVLDTVGRILRDGLRLLDADDRTPTRWGNWAPASLNDDPAWLEERGVNSLQALSFLLCAHAVAADAGGDPALAASTEATFYSLVREHGYAANAVNQKITAPDDICPGDNGKAAAPAA